jgi:hypothetical protein
VEDYTRKLAISAAGEKLINSGTVEAMFLGEVLECMQQLDELGGPEIDGYIQVMEALDAEVNQRRRNAVWTKAAREANHVYYRAHRHDQSDSWSGGRIPIPLWLQGGKWDDQSFENESKARSLWQIGDLAQGEYAEGEEPPFHAIQVWVDQPDPEERITHDASYEPERFYVGVYQTWDDYSLDRAEVLYHGNDEAEAKRIAEDYLREAGETVPQPPTE